MEFLPAEICLKQVQKTFTHTGKSPIHLLISMAYMQLTWCSKRHVLCVSGTGAMGVTGQNRADAMLGSTHHQSGFTLIEVMIVVAIIGIASALAIPNYVDWKAQHDLR